MLGLCQAATACAEAQPTRPPEREHVLASLSAMTSFSAPPVPHGIAWIMADDLGWGEPGAFPSTSPHGRIATPHLNQFASHGVRFTDGYAGYTVCAPSRMTLMTGFHSGHFPREGLNGEALAPAQSASLLTLPAMLQRAGYITAAAGKVAPLTAPVEQGFDSFIGQVDQGLCHNMCGRNYGTILRNSLTPLAPTGTRASSTRATRRSTST